MPVETKEKITAVSIEYLPTEGEMDKNRRLVVGQGLLDSFYKNEMLGYKTHFGVKRYITGLDPEVIKTDYSLTEEEKERKISEINSVIKRLESFFGPGTLDATNEKHWSKVSLSISKKTTNLDLTKPENEIIFHAIKAGGFSGLVAPSLEKAMEDHKQFYLVEPIEFIENRVAPRKIVNKAIGLLEKINETKSDSELFYLAKFLLPVENGYSKRTPKGLIYEDLDKFINGEITKRPKHECADKFIKATKIDKAALAVHCIVKDAIYYNYIYTNQAGELKNNETGGIYGTTIEKAVSHLLNPAYSHELENIKTRVEENWSR